MSANHPRKNQNALRFVLLAIAPVAAGFLASSEELRSQVSAGGPDLSVSNAHRCREWHQNVVTGGASQIAEHRTGHVANGEFFNSLGGSLTQSRGTDADLIEHVSVGDDIRTFRLSLNTLGDGFIEAIANSTLTAIRDAQPASMRGTAVLDPVLEGGGSGRVVRMAWKS